MRRGTRGFMRKGLVWGLGAVLVMAGSVMVLAAATPGDGTGEAADFPVVVIGPGFAQPGNDCLFRAVPQGGTSPFTYQWAWPASGTDDFAHAIMPSGINPVVVKVDVWDSSNQHGTGQIDVNVSESNDPCGI